MKLAEVDWNILRGALLLLFVALLITGGVLGASLHFLDKKERNYQRARGAMLAARAQYQNIDEEERIIANYLPQFRELESAGMVGDEKRLDWIDALRKAASRVELPSLSYVIDSQERYRSELPLPASVFQVYSSNMALDLGLLHEEDLHALLGDLDRNAEGFYTVAHCDLRRTQLQFTQKPDAVNLSAKCGLRWLTIKQSAAPAS